MSAKQAFAPGDYPDRRTRDQRAVERVHVERQIRSLLRVARDDDYRRSVVARLQQRRRANPDHVQIEEVRRPRRMDLLVTQDVVVLRRKTADEKAVAELAERFGLGDVPEGPGTVCVRVRQDSAAPRPMPELVGDMGGGGADVAVEYVIPLAGYIKGAGGPEPSAYAPPFPAVTLDEKRAAPVVAVLDTGVSAHTRSDGYLAMPVPKDDRDPLDAFPPDGLLDAGSGHGTFVAGIIEQVAPGTPLRITRVIDSDGLTSEAAVAAGMRLAVREQGARILNLSLGSETVDDRAPYVLQEVVEDFVDEYPDVLVVCAAGNNADTDPVWPAALAADHANVVAVAALDRYGLPARWSSHGDWVRFSAIGEGVVSTYVQGTEDGELIDDPLPDTFGADSWAAWTGTSFATPQITGALARLMVESDRELSPRAALDELHTRGTDFRAAGYGTGLRILSGT
jgi:hypothetical protein